MPLCSDILMLTCLHAYMLMCLHILEPEERIELSTSSLPWKRSATELLRLRRLSTIGHQLSVKTGCRRPTAESSQSVGREGFARAFAGRPADAGRTPEGPSPSTFHILTCGQGGIRTPVDRSRQIYSLLRLTTPPPTRFS